MSKIDNYISTRIENAKCIQYFRRAIGFFPDKDYKNPDGYKIIPRFSNKKLYDTDSNIYFCVNFGLNDGIEESTIQAINKYMIKALNFKAEDIVKIAKAYAEDDITEAKKQCREEVENLLVQLSKETEV